MNAPLRSSPTGPLVPAPPWANGRPAARAWRIRGPRRYYWSLAFFILLIAGSGIHAYRDLSRPDAWAYWKDLYVSPSMTAALVPDASFNGTLHDRPALFLSGRVGAAAATWFREQLDKDHLVAGDTVVMTSAGGDLDQAVIMGEIIRARGLSTAVGVIDGSGQVRPSRCASACVFIFAGGSVRFGVEGSRLGVHRFVIATPGRDPVAEAQRTTGLVLRYMTRMGVASSFVEAMSATSEIRWLGDREAVAMHLITDPVQLP